MKLIQIGAGITVIGMTLNVIHVMNEWEGPWLDVGRMSVPTGILLIVLGAIIDKFSKKHSDKDK